MAKRGKGLSFSELKVGILVLAGIAIFIFMVLSATGGITLRKPFVLKTRFAEVDGLIPGNEVRIAGVRAGNVDTVTFGALPRTPEDRDTVEVTMSLDSDIAQKWIRDDSKATLGNIGLLGDKVVEISPGTRQGKPLQSGAYIESTPGTNIRKIISGVDPMIADLTQTAEEIKTMVAKVNQGQGTLGQLVNNPKVYQDLDATVLEARNLIKDVREGEGSLGQLINDPALYRSFKDVTTRLENVVKQIDQGQGTVARLIKDPELYKKIDDTMTMVRQTATRLDEISGRINRGEGTLGKFINDPALHEETKETMANLKDITERLDKGEGTAGALLHDRALYDNLNTLSSELVRLLYDFRQDPKKFLRIKVSIF
jgi:phospholipid/cholesterol/gamma-HCH transport system substrate-binding protein